MLNRRRALIENAVSGEELPSGYTRKQYIQGAINPNRIQNAGILSCEIPFTNYPHLIVEMESNNYKANGVFLCAPNDVTRRLGVGVTSPDVFIFRMNPSNYIKASSYSLNTKYCLEQSSQGCFIDGSKVLNDVYYPFNEQPLKLLIGYTVDYSYFASIWKIYSVIVKDASELTIFNGIPALDENGRPCLYDTVSKTPKYSVTNTDFYTD